MSPLRGDAIGQLLVIAFDEARWKASHERLLRLCCPGGVLVSARTLETPQSTAPLLRRIALATGTPPFLALEEEGGRFDPLLPPLPSPRAAAQKGVSAIARLGQLTGAALRVLGFNTNFAPVLDLSTAVAESSRGARTFGSDPAEVARCGKAFVRGLEQQGILACGKHFPGLGGDPYDSLAALRLVVKPMAQLWREDLVPYRQLLPRLAMVLMSHAAYKAYDFDLPCSAALSARVVEGLLRVRLGYARLVIGQRLECQAVRGKLDLGEAAVKSVNAGCDLLLVRGEKHVAVVLTALKKGVESGKLPPARIEQAFERIRLAKRGLALPRGKVSKSAYGQLVRQFEDFRRELRPQERKIA